ncbi:MAG: TonB-dependent receptor [Gammaproteobacteria bacterium]|nr:TonB-dependent receptor [Gammaproteobacteria bacterium]MDH5630066.1 TonB-dependent receptor [Gammaproteobacteria bacterium]
MKGKIKLTTLATLMALSATSYAQETEEGQENQLVITANRIQQNLNDVLADVEIIDRVDIEKIQPQSLVDLLVNISGVDFVQRGGHGQDASAFIRGTNSNHVLVLIDGVRVGSSTLGTKSLYSIAIPQIERIEIVKGPRAALWGSDAIGGVIQIFTRRYNGGEQSIAVTTGSNGTQNLDVSFGIGGEKFNNTITYSQYQADGFSATLWGDPDEDGYLNEAFALRGQNRLSETSAIDWVVLQTEGESDYDTFWGGDVAHHENENWHVRYSNLTNQWTNQFMVAESKDKGYYLGNGVTIDLASIFETTKKQASYLARTEISPSTSLAVGFDQYTETVDSSTTVYNLNERTTDSAFLSITHVGDEFLSEITKRSDDVEHVAKKETYNYSAGYKLTGNDLISFSKGEAFKAPSFNDLYFPWGGNPNLEFELSKSKEISYKRTVDNYSFDLSAYDSKVKNLIQWIPDAFGVWSPQNIGMVDISGVEANFKYRSGDTTHRFMMSNVSSEDANTGQQLLLRAKKHAGYELTTTYENINWFVQLQYVGSRSDYDYQTFQLIDLDDYTRVNLGLDYQLRGNWKLNFKVNDLFDEAPTVVSGYTPVEREYFITLTHQNF